MASRCAGLSAGSIGDNEVRRKSCMRKNGKSFLPSPRVIIETLLGDARAYLW